MAVKIYKNIFFDKKENKYFFISPNGEKRELVTQEGYLLVYILENLLDLKDKNVTFNDR